MPRKRTKWLPWRPLLYHGGCKRVRQMYVLRALTAKQILQSIDKWLANRDELFEQSPEIAEWYRLNPWQLDEIMERRAKAVEAIAAGRKYI